jgi:hypothetical protein
MFAIQALYQVRHFVSPFLGRCFGESVFELLPGLLHATILLTSASKVARITGLGYQLPAAGHVDGTT